MSNLSRSQRHFPVRDTDADSQPSGSARVSAIWHLPEVLREFGVDPGEVLEAAGVRQDLFVDRENRIDYPDFGRLLLVWRRAIDRAPAAN